MNHQLATPKSESERREERLSLQQLHPGNRFRLMLGQSLLTQDTPLPKLPRPVNERVANWQT